MSLSEDPFDPHKEEPETLIQSARNGSTAALGQLLEQARSYLTVLVRLQIHQRLQGKIDPEDVVQDTCLGAHRDFVHFRGTTEKEFAAWLRQILAHTLANTVRHYQGAQQRDVRLERQLVSELHNSSIALNRAFISPTESPSQDAARRENGLLLASAIQKLPSEESQLLMLRHFEGLSFPEVAGKMGRTLDNVKKMWPKALAHLRQLVRELSNESEN